VRTREIGVRKVLGASVPGIIGLLAKDFIQLVLIAIVVDFPLAWFSMQSGGDCPAQPFSRWLAAGIPFQTGLPHFEKTVSFW
jgi:ABC-type antimicrobial peptide transport system permease subunit